MSSTHSPYLNRRNNYEVKLESSDKDILISQLKAHIFELEQHEKNYDNLNQKFRNLQNECSILNEEKIRLEYDLKQRTESMNKQILELRTENENLQLTLNDKLALNKKLYNDNNNLIKTLESRNMEINELRERLDDLIGQNNTLLDDKSALERMVQNLNEIKATQKVEITKLIEDNQKLSKICQDQDKSLKNLDAERVKLLSRNDEMNFELKNVLGKLKSREENLNYTQKQLDESKSTSAKLSHVLKDYEKQIDLLRNDIGSLNNNLQKERMARMEAEKSNEQLQIIVNERDRENHRLSNELDNSRAVNQRVSEDKLSMNAENERLKNHIMLLTEQNQKLIQEIENITDQDERISQQLVRKEKVMGFVRNNKVSLEKSLSNLDEFLNRTNRSTLSPSYHLNRSKGN